MRRVFAVLLAVLTLAGTVELALPDVAQAQSNPPTPRLRLTPDCIGDPGSTQVRVRGSGFARNSQVRLRFSQVRIIGSGPAVMAVVGFVGAGPPAARTAQGGDIVGTASTDGLGTFEADVVLSIPIPLRSVPSRRTWQLDAETVGGGPSSTVFLPTNCPPSRVAVDTGCNASNAGQMPSEFSLLVDGYLPNSKAEVTIHGPGGVMADLVLPTDGQGRIRETFNTKGYGSGDHRATVEDADNFETGWFALPCPTVDVQLRPDCSRSGSPPNRVDIAVVATGLPPLRDAWVIFDSPRAHEFWPTKIDRAGRVTITISPYRRPAGTYTLRVRSVEDNESAVRQRTVSFEFPCEPTTVTTAQTCGRPLLEGDRERRLSFEVSGGGFEPGQLSVIYDADEVIEAETFSAEVNAAGRFSTTITPRLRPLGTYRIVATQDLASFSRSQRAPLQTIEAETTFRVPCRDREPPPLVLDPVCGPVAPGAESAYEIGVSGREYYPNSTVIVSFGRSESFETLAGGDGRFTVVIQPSGKGESRVPVRAQQHDTLGQLAAGAAARFGVPCPIDPSIEISPQYGRAGYTTTVTGIDFYPNTIVTLTWDKGITADQPLEVVVGEDGNFEALVFILPNDWPGERTLAAGTLEDADAFDVEGTFVVTPGTGVPGGSNDDLIGRR
jgi:hypothetical protein